VSATDVLDDAGYDFSDLSDDSTEVVEPSTRTGTSRSGGTTTAAGTRRRGRGPGKGRLDTLQKKLSGEMFQLGTMAGLPLPVTGYYVCQESDAFTRAVVELAGKRTEWVEALERLADIQPAIVIGRTALGIGAAMAVDRKRAEPDTRFMQFIGVYSAWKAIDEKRKPGEGTEDGNRYKPPPVQFTPV
jgi:hypothetical protein